MIASVGDRIIIRSHHTGEPNRDCEVLDVRGPNGEPPYLVRWDDSGREALLYPGSDATIEHFDYTASN